MHAAMRLSTALAVFLGLPNSYASSQIWPWSQSEAASAWHDFFVIPNKPMEHKAFCGKLILQYSNMDALSNSSTQAKVRWFAYMEKNGYLTKDVGGFRGTLMGDVSYTFTPTEKLWQLADRKEGDCFFCRNSTMADLKIVEEKKHDRYKDIVILYASWKKNLGAYERVNEAAWMWSTAIAGAADFC